MIRSFIVTDDLEVQGQVQTSHLMPNVNTTLYLHQLIQIGNQIVFKNNNPTLYDYSSMKSI